MGVKIIWRCDICRDEKPNSEVLAVHFTSNKSGCFELRPAERFPGNQHQGVHICDSCLDRFRNPPEPQDNQ